MPPVLVYMTAASADDAARIGRALVERRLAACANLLGPIRSFYWWDGAVQDDAEVAFIAKTRSELVPELTAAVKAMHPYTVPCVAALPITGGNPDFLAWIEAETCKE